MKIIIIDDDRLISLSLKTILEAEDHIEISAIGNSGEEAVQLYEQYQPDVLLMDIQMRPLSGLEAAAIILSRFPNAKILLLTTFLDDEYIIKAIRLGAKGYILKQDFESIAPAINAVYNGQSVFGNEIVEKMPLLFNSGKKEASITLQNQTHFHLSEKEFQIVQLVADGLNNKEIAEHLFLSEGTVRNYISTILEKLALRDRTQLACFYYKNLK